MVDTVWWKLDVPIVSEDLILKTFALHADLHVIPANAGNQWLHGWIPASAALRGDDVGAESWKYRGTPKKIGAF